MSGEDTSLIGAELAAGGKLSITTGGDFSVQAAIDSQRREFFSNKMGLVTMTTITERSYKEVVKLTSLAAGEGYAFGIGGNASLTLYDYAGTDGANPQDLYPEELLAIEGLELLKQSLADEYFYDKQVALSPAFKALVAIAVGTFVVPGLFTALGFSGTGLTGLSLATYNAATAFTSTFIVESIDGAVSGDFDIGDILKGAAFSGITAGLTSAINVSSFIKPDTALGQSLAGNLIAGFGDKQLTMLGLLDAGLDGVISSGLSSVVYGTDFGSGVLAEVVSYIANGVAGAAIHEVSDVFGHTTFSIEKLVAKATINCLAAEATGAGCASGALGSLVTELVVATGSTLGAKDADDYRNRLKMIAAVAGYFASQGKAGNVHATANAALLDFNNNYLNTQQLRSLRAELDACGQEAKCINTVLAGYVDLSKAQDEALAACVDDACRAGHLAQIIAAEMTGEFDQTMSLLVMTSYLQNNSYKTLLTSLQHDRAEAVYEALDGNPVLRTAVQKEVTELYCAGGAVASCSYAVKANLARYDMLTSEQKTDFALETAAIQAKAQREAVDQLKAKLCGNVTGAACDALVTQEIERQKAKAARLGGVLMVVNGAFSVVAGTGMASTCETVVGCVASGALLTYGVDQLLAGGVAIWSGQGQVSLGAQALMSLGLSAENAEMVYGLAVAGLETAAIRQLIANPNQIKVTYQAYQGSLNIKTWTVDPSFRSADEAAGVLVNGSYIKNPTARNLLESVTASGNIRVDGQLANGQYMYVVDTGGNIIIGTRGGQRMPHPTLVGGSNPQVQAAGIVDIRGGRIYSVDNASGHFKPGSGSLQNAESAFGSLPSNVFHRDFQGYLPFDG